MEQLEISKIQIEIESEKLKKLEELKMERVQQEDFIYARKQLEPQTDSSDSTAQMLEHKKKDELKRFAVENVAQESLSGKQLKKVNESISTDEQLSKDKKLVQEQAGNAPVNISADKLEEHKSMPENAQESVQLQQSIQIEKNQKGYYLQEYLNEVKSKVEKNDARIDEVISVVHECQQLVEDKNTDIKSMLNKSRKLTAAIQKVDSYLRATKNLKNNNITPSDNVDGRSLRESMKMLRVQLFLEKMGLDYEEKADDRELSDEKIERQMLDERKLFEQQLESDAVASIIAKRKDIDENENKQINGDEKLKSRQKIDAMYRMKLEENRDINNAELLKTNRTIRERTEMAFQLQYKLSGKYGLRHKAFSRNKDYQERLNRKIAQIKPKIYAGWLNENLESLNDNAKQLIEEIRKHSRMFKAGNKEEYFSIEKLQNIFGMNLNNPEMFKEAESGYNLIFNELVRIDNDENENKITEKFKRLIAAQKVLIEKRQKLSTIYEESIGFKPAEDINIKESGEVNGQKEQVTKDAVDEQMKKEASGEGSDKDEVVSEQEKKSVQDIAGSFVDNIFREALEKQSEEKYQETANEFVDSIFKEALEKKEETAGSQSEKSIQDTAGRFVDNIFTEALEKQSEEKYQKTANEFVDDIFKEVLERKGETAGSQSKNSVQDIADRFVDNIFKEALEKQSEEEYQKAAGEFVDDIFKEVVNEHTREFTDKVIKQVEKEDEKSRGDTIAYQKIKNDELDKKKEADLEFQRNNNEYGLQEMATQERELEKEKLQKQTDENEKKAQEIN